MSPVVDIHTHIYPPSYMDLLRSRTTLPYVRTFPPSTEERLLILPGEDSPEAPVTKRGRPIGPEYHEIQRKVDFMDLHDIDVSVISLANPWLDFLEPNEAAPRAVEINNELDEICSRYPGRLYTFGTLPVSGSTEDIVAEVHRLKTLKHVRGVVMGTTGMGDGLDDPRLEKVYESLQETNQIIFLHPHYGLPKEVYGPRGGDFGHVLPLALGFPIETTIAIMRLYLSGVFDRYPKLSILVAHSGGTIPFLAGRLESCIEHDEHFGKLAVGRKSFFDALRENIYLDGVIYNEIGLKSAIDATGEDRIMFGTDNPFFSPANITPENPNPKWPSVLSNLRAIEKSFTGENREDSVLRVLGGNAKRILNLNL